MDRIKTAWRMPLLCLLLSAATLATFWPVLRNDFIRFDDHGYITNNPHVLSGLKWDNINWAFRSGEDSNWHPLTWISHMLDVQLFGLNPAWHHLANLLFHTANSVLLLLLLRRMTGALWRSAFVAALFALHPLHVESVAWAAERKDVLSTFFFMLTLLAYAKYVAGGGWRMAGQSTKHQAPGTRLSTLFWYVLALLLFALGLMSKPMLVTLPCVLLLLDFWPLRRFSRSALNSQPSTAAQASKLDVRRPMFVPLLLEKLPFFALSAASCVITFIVQDKGHAVSTAEGLPLDQRLINVVVAYAKYLGMAFWPRDLCIFYPHPGILGTAGERPAWQVLGAVLVVAGITFYALIRLKREPWLATGWLWYLGALVPVIGLVQVGGQEVADRYTYIPLIGIFLGLTWTIAYLIETGLGPLQPARASAILAASPEAGAAPQPNAGQASLSADEEFLSPVKDTRGRLPYFLCAVVGCTCVALLGFCAVLTRHQIGFWKDNYTLFKHALAVTKHNAPAEYYVGVGNEEQGNFDSAAEHFRAAIKYDPSFADAYYSLGVILASKDETQEAIEQYEAAIRAKPWHGLSYNGLGAMYWRLREVDKAIAQYREALRLNPELSESHFNLGVALDGKGDTSAAAEQYAEVLRLRPSDVEAPGKLARALGKLGRLPQAEAELSKDLTWFPSNSVARVNLGDVLRLEGKKEAATAQYLEALRLSPKQPAVQQQLGLLLLEQGKTAEAATHLAEAVRLKADFPEALTSLGRCLAAQGKLTEAATNIAAAALLCPTNTETQLALGNVLMLTGKTNEAGRAFAAALALEPDLAQKTLQSGKDLLARGQVVAALASFTSAAWLNPESAAAHENLGLALARSGRVDDAAAQFEKVLQLRRDEQAWYNLAMARLMQNRPGEALTNYLQALKLKPDWPPALNDLAWLLATHPQAELRDGPEAVRLAEHACQVSGGKEARLWGTLDAAYAEAGRFEDAISTAEKARTLALGAGENDIAQAAEKRLALYRNHQPYHQ